MALKQKQVQAKSDEKNISCGGHNICEARAGTL